MAYLHCHTCNFSQDDFWDKDGYNPTTSLKHWKSDLFSTKIDEPFSTDRMFIKENGNITLREVIAQQFERVAKRIRNMKYRTLEEFKEKNPERICPVCGNKTLDID